jgi:exodeoxyribonuclease V alpha subunit
VTLLRSGSTYHERRLKNRIREGESPLRWLDYYAAEHAYEMMAKHARSINVAEGARGAGSKADELVSDLVLLLSYLSSLGHHKLPLASIKHYSAYLMFKHSESLEQLNAALAQHSFVYSAACIKGNLFESEPAGQLDAQPEQKSEQLDLWGEQTALEKSTFANSEVSKTSNSAESDLLPFLAFENDEVYLYRYWAMQNNILDWRNKRLMQPLALTDNEAKYLGPMLRALFKLDAVNKSIDFQALAGAQSLVSSLSVVSGGPGTGKTTTAAKIIVLHLLRAQMRSAGQTNSQLANVVCLAPTGKAAQRLASGVREQAEGLIESLSLELEQKCAVSNALPEEGATIHRYILASGEKLDPLMKTKSKSFTARLALNQHMHDEGAPCLIVVDESSMLDLALMKKLIQVTSDKTAVVFLGDYFQLAPVEPGDVFGDWVREFSRQKIPASQLSCISEMLQQELSQFNDEHSVNGDLAINPLTVLRKSYRFAGALADCAELVKSGSMSDFIEFAVAQTEHSAVQMRRLDDANSAGSYLSIMEDAHLAVLRKAYQGYRNCTEQKASLDELHKTFLEVQILCSTYQGPYGADAINMEIDRYIRSAVSGRGSQESSVASNQAYYHGQPILLTQNYAEFGLYNGDIGFVIEQAEGKSAELSYLLSFYREGAEPITILPTRISNRELAYAMSIHKSQGSEYSDVHVVIAPYAKELLTRSLLYTGITRAKNKVSLYLDEASLKNILA